MSNTMKPEDLKSGYVVQFKNGTLGMIIRVGRFTKVIITPPEGFEYLSSWDDKLRCKKHIPEYYGCGLHDTRRKSELDIVAVYGLIQGRDNYHEAFSISKDHRELLWKRNPTIKMTLKEVCDKLGYDVEIVKEDYEGEVYNHEAR